jgi:predicted amidohydrolase
MRLILTQPTLRALETNRNLEMIESLVQDVRGSAEDLLLLPEHFTFDDRQDPYLDFVRRIASSTGCTVVGGSHHRNVEDGRRLNVGCVVDPSGTILATYEKLRPYFNELQHIVPGDAFGEFTIAGRNILVLVCADFWYSDIILKASAPPDVVLVPSLSVSRKLSAAYARSLWRHLAISRAYEFGVYVGISDWSAQSYLPKYRTAGVGGLADPTRLESEQFFQAVGEGTVADFALDFGALDVFRDDRRMRGFFWK